MSRRSTRLESSGYYNIEDRPLITYRETPQRIFRTRRRKKRDTNFTDSDDHTMSESKSSWKIFCFLFLLLPVCFGCGYVFATMHLSEVQDQLLELKAKLNPLANNLPNIALESLGAIIVHHQTSEPYQTLEPEMSFRGIPIYRKPVSPTILLQGHSHLTPGKCWAFAGEQGHLLIAPPQPFTISHVTLGHISKNVSPSGSISNAPKEFAVYGMYDRDAEEGVHLGTFIYDQNGDSVQTFKVPDCGVFKFVMLIIKSNWGSRDNTCLYDFRIHGHLTV